LTSLYTHLSWFCFLVLLFIFSLFFSLYITYTNSSLFISIHLFDLSFFNNSVSLSFDFIASWFFTTVVFISSIISVFSFFYIAPYSKSPYFLWLTVLFIISILVVIRVSDLFFLILGWDGLGLISFFLIVYYQNSSSITSGLFTVLINRIGDCFFLLSIILISYNSFTLTWFSSNVLSNLSLIILCITFMTKSAIFPFSPWLPLAIAAPTPISALVHSSTLVTAGLFLIMRFSYFLYSSVFLIKFLLILSVFTSFYAGLNSIFEKDLKKLIALSTLSHLGFIGIAFSRGLLHLAFFHLLSHAFFKSLLFISIGDIIINLDHSQDIRYLSVGGSYTPFSSYIMHMSLFNLWGLPNVRGFFSKDLVLEIINYSSSSFFFTFLIFLNVFFTFFYRFQLFFYRFQSNKLNTFRLFRKPLFFHAFLLSFMGVFSVIFGFLFLKAVLYLVIFYPVPVSFKFVPLLLLFVFFFYLSFFLILFASQNVFASHYFSSIMFLSTVLIRVSSNLYLKRVSLLSKTFELGFINYSLNIYLPSISSFFSHLILKQSLINPLLITLLSFLWLTFLSF